MRLSCAITGPLPVGLSGDHRAHYPDCWLTRRGGSMYDLTITGGSVVDGTGDKPFRADIGIRTAGSSRFVVATATTPDCRGGGGDHRCHRPHRHPGLRRHPHPLRRPGQLGRPAGAVQHARRDDGRQRQLRRRFRPGAAGPRAVAHRVDGGCRGHPGTALTEGITWGWESFPEYLDAVEKQKLAVDFGTQVAHGAVRAMRWAIAVPATRPPPPMTSPRWRASCRRRSRLGRWAFRPRAPRRTGPSTANRCRGRMPPRMNCSRSDGRWRPAVRRCSRSHRRAPRVRAWTAR